MNQRDIRVVGIGSAFGDDQVGILVAQRLQAAVPGAKVHVASSPGELLGRLEACDQMHVVDACRSAGTPGRIIRYEWPAAALAETEFSGTHDLSLATALRLAKECQAFPASLILWGVETAAAADPESFLAPLSPLVAAAADRLVDQLTNELRPAEVHHA